MAMRSLDLINQEDLQNTGCDTQENNTIGGDAVGRDAQGEGHEGRTFTQEQVNEIVKERLGRERKKYAAAGEPQEPHEEDVETDGLDTQIKKKEEALLALEAELDQKQVNQMLSSFGAENGFNSEQCADFQMLASHIGVTADNCDAFAEGLQNILINVGAMEKPKKSINYDDLSRSEKRQYTEKTMDSVFHKIFSGK